MTDCIFSVIIPCYNSEQYISESIESVVNQTYSKWELILINDGSTDETLDILNEYAAKDARIKVFSKENGGYATAVNYGLNNITGDYFLFLGSDDRLGEDLFESLMAQIKIVNESPDMIAFRTRHVVDGVVGEIDQYTKFDAVTFSKCSVKEFIEHDPVNSAIFSTRDTSRCYKRELLGDTRYFGKTGVDADGIFSMLLCHKANSFLNVPVDGYFWTLRSDSVSATSSISKQLDRISNWHRFFEVISERYADKITKAEMQYIDYYSLQIVALSSIPQNAISYRNVIKREASFIKEIAHKFNAKIHKHLAFVANIPVLFSIIRLSYVMFCNGVRRLLK